MVADACTHTHTNMKIETKYISPHFRLSLMGANNATATWYFWFNLLNFLMTTSSITSPLSITHHPFLSFPRRPAADCASTLVITSHSFKKRRAYKAFVRSSVEYCSPWWAGAPLSHLFLLDSVESQALNIFGISNDEQITVMLVSSQLLHPPLNVKEVMFSPLSVCLLLAKSKIL